MSSTTPFTKTELLPQEEMLEVKKSKDELLIGIPCETSYQEKRVCLTPDAVSTLVAHGHRVLIESNAGANANFSDNDYSEAGGEITNDTAKVFACDTVIKIAPPTFNELSLMQPGSVLFSALQLKTRSQDYFKQLTKKKITGLAFEFIKDHYNSYPIVKALSEIAGKSTVLIASELLTNLTDGNGLLFGNVSGVPPTEVLILGAGTVGEFAARSSLGLGADVKIFDSSLTRLRNLQRSLGHEVYTSTFQPSILKRCVARADVLIGAVKGKNRSPVIVTEEMVQSMKTNAVIIDVSIDMGGCVETSEITTHDHPTLKKYDVFHYGVPNIPSRYARTSSISMSSIFTPYLVHIGNQGGLENAIRNDSGLRNGLYTYHGVLTSKSVANWFNISYRDPNLLIF